MLESDISVIATSMFLKLITALFAFAGVRVAISNMDKAFEINIKGWLNEAPDLPRAIYLGARMFAVCLLFGMIFSYEYERWVGT